MNSSGKSRRHICVGPASVFLCRGFGSTVALALTASRLGLRAPLTQTSRLVARGAGVPEAVSCGGYATRIADDEERDPSDQQCPRHEYR